LHIGSAHRGLAIALEGLTQGSVTHINVIAGTVVAPIGRLHILAA